MAVLKEPSASWPHGARHVQPGQRRLMDRSCGWLLEKDVFLFRTLPKAQASQRAKCPIATAEEKHAASTGGCWWGCSREMKEAMCLYTADKGAMCLYTALAWTRRVLSRGAAQGTLYG